MTTRQRAESTPADTQVRGKTVVATLDDALQGLRLLALYRVVTPVFQAGALLVVAEIFKLDAWSLPVRYLLGLEVLLAAATLVRLRLWPKVSAQELMLQAAVDIGLFSAMLYFTGGSTNPFAPLYVLPVMIVAVALPSRWVWGAAVATMACYVLLRLYYVPLVHPQGEAVLYELHEDGMVINHALSVAMLVYFCNRLFVSLRRQALLAREAHEAMMRSESVAAIGALAAGAAHELGSPLATVAVIAAEIERDYPGDQRLQRDLRVLGEQVAVCKQILVKMARAGNERRAESACATRLDEFIQATIQRMRTLNPGATILSQLDEVTAPPFVVGEETLRQALSNLIQNAVHVSPQHVHVSADWSGDDLVLTVIDEGPGFSTDSLQTLGRKFDPEQRSERGLGVGLLLGAESLRRLGGSLELMNRATRGACVKLRVPLAALLIEKPSSTHHAPAPD